MQNTNSVGSLISSHIVDYTNNHSPAVREKKTWSQRSDEAVTDFGDITDYIYRKIDYSDNGGIDCSDVLSANGILAVMLALTVCELLSRERNNQRFLTDA